ncbi:hypothetical protein CEXT_553761 [Caerostris extrusa]|uniref:Uncharacterized protein n=1 Tax=Caerostris extrusa TaxID=172846 RepID=A0AAV4PUE0_CAEEX|nr:hypothetical protein CEXT_553761 [Caerostris extrusa]
MVRNKLGLLRKIEHGYPPKALGCIYSIELDAGQTAKRGNCRITIDRQAAAPNQSFRARLLIDIAASCVTNGEEERNCFTPFLRCPEITRFPK